MLDVIRDEELQTNYLHVGAYLLDKLRTLQVKHELIGDVRGAGLFIGVELVNNPESLEPAADEAYSIINRMKERRLLLSIDGPYHNVIKIKPPIVFTEDDADFLAKMLDESLSQIG